MKTMNFQNRCPSCNSKELSPSLHALYGVQCLKCSTLSHLVLRSGFKLVLKQDGSYTTKPDQPVDSTGHIVPLRTPASKNPFFRDDDPVHTEQE